MLYFTFIFNLHNEWAGPHEQQVVFQVADGNIYGSLATFVCDCIVVILRQSGQRIAMIFYASELLNHFEENMRPHSSTSDSLMLQGNRITV